jgi:hypothetical protein
MPASTSFVFDGEGRLNQTIVLFPNADLQPRRLDRGYPISGRSPESACCLQPKLHGAFVTRTS